MLLDLPVPTPTIALMGDFNFPAGTVSWSREDGALLPRVAAHWQVAKHSIVQTVDCTSQGSEVLDLIWTNNLRFTDHSVITTSTSYKVK